MTWFVDRSRYETGMTCLRKRYWNYHFESSGVVPSVEGPDFGFGKEVHSFIEVDKHGTPFSFITIEDGYTPDGHDKNLEWYQLGHGLIRVFNKFTLPAILSEYEWISSEVEMDLDLGNGIIWMTRLDGVLRRKSDGLYFVLEAKTTGWPDILGRQAPRNFQMLMEIEAMRAHYKLAPEQIGGALLLTFNKGYKKGVSEREKASGMEGFRRLSPFTYWYKRDLANGDTEYRLDWAKGWDRVPTASIPGWFDIALSSEEMSLEMREQVKLWPGISYDPVMVQHVKDQVVSREKVMSMMLEKGLTVDQVYPQNFLNCNNDGGFKRECPFALCCYSPNVARDPIASEHFEWRKPNHPQEQIPSDIEGVEIK